MDKETIIFWFEAPPKVSKGAFNYLTKHWHGKVIYVINHPMDAYRKAANWEDGDFGNAQIIELYNDANEKQVIDDLFKDNPKAIHICGGFCNNMMYKVSHYVMRKDIRLVVFSERPVLMGNCIEKFARTLYFKVKYTYLKTKYSPYVGAFLPLGSLGVNTFIKYGWDEKKMFPFMYNPQITEVRNDISVIANKQIRFLYVGRFYYKTKGIDTLMYATQKLKGDWSLDLVGGYGAQADEVIAWAEKQENVNYIGTWNSMNVASNMQKYDVVVVPTKYDGWNLIPNEAIHAGIGTIVTDEAVSHELIEKSKSGIVISSRNVKALSAAMQNVIDNPLLVEKWKINAKAYFPRISPQVVGEYLMDIINYTFFDKEERPCCPWL